MDTVSPPREFSTSSYAETMLNDIRSAEIDAMDIETGCPLFPAEKGDKLMQVLNRKRMTLPAHLRRASIVNEEPKDLDTTPPKNRSSKMISLFVSIYKLILPQVQNVLVLLGIYFI